MLQADGQKLESRKMVSAQLTIGRQSKAYNIVAEVLDIGERRQCILGLSWLGENGFTINPIQRSLDDRHGCSIPYISIKGEAVMVDGDFLLIVDVASEYPRYLHVSPEEQANRLPPHRKWDHEITLT